MKGLESSNPESMLPLCCPPCGHTGDPLQNMTLLAPISDLQPLGLRDQSAWGLCLWDLLRLPKLRHQSTPSS